MYLIIYTRDIFFIKRIGDWICIFFFHEPTYYRQKNLGFVRKILEKK